MKRKRLELIHNKMAHLSSNTRRRLRAKTSVCPLLPLIKNHNKVIMKRAVTKLKTTLNLLTNSLLNHPITRQHKLAYSLPPIALLQLNLKHNQQQLRLLVLNHLQLLYPRQRNNNFNHSLPPSKLHLLQGMDHQNNQQFSNSKVQLLNKNLLHNKRQTVSFLGINRGLTPLFRYYR